MKINVFPSVPLSKVEIKRLGGGRSRGTDLLVRIDLAPGPVVWVYGRLRNQYQSQNQSSCHPEGWEPITAEGIKSELRYDIATAKIEIPVPAVGNGGAITFVWDSFPATLFRYDDRREDHALLLREAREWTRRWRLLRALNVHWSEAQPVAQLMAEALGVQWRATTGEALVTRVTRLAYNLDKKTCDDLIALLAVPAQATPVAA